MTEHARRGIRAAQIGILVNAALAATKLVAGIVGNTYALVADAVESIADIFGSLIVWAACTWPRSRPTRTIRSGTARPKRSLPPWSR
jgi:divalent metal cation (Fe/Co/Zn/Cd) transporter